MLGRQTHRDNAAAGSIEEFFFDIISMQQSWKQLRGLIHSFWLFKVFVTYPVTVASCEHNLLHNSVVEDMG